jgi:hypothetical protein
MRFEVIGKVAEIETIAVGQAIHELTRLRKVYGAGRWRKLKGVAVVRLRDETVCRAELHWYEVHGGGRHEMKIKQFLDD